MFRLWGFKDLQTVLYSFTDIGHTARTVEQDLRDHHWNVEARNNQMTER